MIEKKWLSALKPVAYNATQWNAYIEMLDFHLESNNKTLQQSSEMIDVYRAQGAIHLIDKLKKLRDEINAIK